MVIFMVQRNVRIMSLNCRGLKKVDKCRKLFVYLKNEIIDLAMLQETHLTTNDLNWFNRMWKGNTIHSLGTNRSKGVVILIRKGFELQLLHQEEFENGRISILHCIIGNTEHLFVNLYAPNVDDLSFFEKVSDVIKDYQCASVVLLGDFNLVLDPTIDRTENKVHKPKSVAFLKRLMSFFKTIRYLA